MTYIEYIHNDNKTVYLVIGLEQANSSKHIFGPLQRLMALRASI